jgi:hypothetical protein
MFLVGKAKESKQMSKLYLDWLGKSVVLRVSSGGLDVALRCMLLDESDEKLRIRIGDSWDVDIYKDMVQSVEGDRQFSPC